MTRRARPVPPSPVPSGEASDVSIRWLAADAAAAASSLSGSRKPRRMLRPCGRQRAREEGGQQRAREQGGQQRAQEQGGQQSMPEDRSGRRAARSHPHNSRATMCSAKAHEVGRTQLMRRHPVEPADMRTAAPVGVAQRASLPTCNTRLFRVELRGHGVALTHSSDKVLSVVGGCEHPVSIVLLGDGPATQAGGGDQGTIRHKHTVRSRDCQSAEDSRLAPCALAASTAALLVAWQSFCCSGAHAGLPLPHNLLFCHACCRADTQTHYIGPACRSRTLPPHTPEGVHKVDAVAGCYSRQQV